MASKPRKPAEPPQSNNSAAEASMDVEVLPVPELDHERLDKALKARRVRLPERASTPEDICSFLDSVSKEL